MALRLAREEVDQGADQQAAGRRGEQPPVPGQVHAERKGVLDPEAQLARQQVGPEIRRAEERLLEQLDQEPEADRAHAARQAAGDGDEHHEQVFGETRAASGDPAR